MYSIGKFSKITGINTKTLVWYDSVGLLKPCKVDPENGYRYYDDDSFKALINIRFWQAMGFSVKEIVNLSKDVISNKIDELQTKVDFITSNISFLNKFQEENMEKEDIDIFNIDEKLLKGKWHYQKTSTDFNDVIDPYTYKEKEKYMPEYLFFGEDNVGTDLNEVFGYTNCFALNDLTKTENGQFVKREFWYIIVNYRSTLVLYEKPKFGDEPGPVKFHIYEKKNGKLYSSKDIQTICDKYCPMLGAMHYDFNKDYVGNYKMYDEIYESEIDTYIGRIKNKNASYSLDPMFDILDIEENRDVYVMRQNDELELNTSQGHKIFNRENTKMTISMDSQRRLGDFYINNFNGQRHNGTYKKYNSDEYLFINLDNNVDLDVKVYVFKKLKEHDENSLQDDALEDSQPYIEVKISSNIEDENSEYKWVKVRADNAYIKSPDYPGMAHYKIREKEFVKILQHYSNINEFEEYATNGRFDFCFIKYHFDGKNIELKFNHSNESLLTLARSIYRAITYLIISYSIDFKD